MPLELIQDCIPKLPPKKITYAETIIYSEELLNTIEMCNADKKALREINKSES